MFLKFFLTLNNSTGRLVGGNSGKNKLLVSTHNDHKKERHETITFNNVLDSFMRSIDNPTRFDFGLNQTREILINISDEAMFQLETLSVPENCYCTYNLNTKLIGFGNNMAEAEEATQEDNFGWGYKSKSSNNDLFFNYFVEMPTVLPYKFTVPDVFYEQVLQELKPYIVNEKLHIFKGFSDFVLKSSKEITEYFDNYYTEVYDESKIRSLSPFKKSEMRKVIEWFMEDDIDIVANKESLAIEYGTIGILCRKIMNVSGETF
ncbi:hypothetical protein pEaSNUABM50_00059 [Erwinia phage pEa_SNUABM_50]|uniref:Uncharacterized protein n=4 Tax=Eneladusvirus BF TaxID=2560751 RepID=A0A7L8ZM39_9CAUD|nr:hypothetical protein FDH34_gp061 [Serratia phage BF]QOI70999.1 hypothetical protein pEaSNUABM12_00061 [Erwinia phage pEa_SNUABM_12]QOI71544.1 hypothetical protein pEaSNUABM47_00060 [Erwinia phage pEa_SNUABM_47]QOI72083.1 hypothetical protein pEaSNUABM50_00059 [Erwinia phage pEa_SNUABM_50]QXO11208.1 hypothetical protein pEaSNUABM19_00062 [Erwinia phage pEa_SNUABM_19]QXO11756.1 hypothetical protein pEaSNUABM44_00060 [Erwinia phage pEa_SNUABM_44]QXO12307.1 hypothetical protein pEaSNUABM49_000